MQFRSANAGSSGASKRQFTSNMLEFLFKSDLIFTTTDSSGMQLREVQMHQMRQFRYIQGKIPRKFGCTFPRQFNYVQKKSSGALRREVQVVTSGKT
jgi:hypothetical protein